MYWFFGVVLFSCFRVTCAEFNIMTLTHPLFSFDTYPTLQSINDVQPQPINFETQAPIYYSHIYGSLRSTVKGNVTQFRYIPTTNSTISFQIWNMSTEGDEQIKAVLQVIPEVGGSDIKVATANVAIDVGDMIGVWVEHSYPVGMLQLQHQSVTDYLVVYDDWYSRRQPTDADSKEDKVVTESVNSRDSHAFMAAVQVTIQHEVEPQSTTEGLTTPNDFTTTDHASNGDNWVNTETHQLIIILAIIVSPLLLLLAIARWWCIRKLTRVIKWNRKHSVQEANSTITNSDMQNDSSIPGLTLTSLPTINITSQGDPTSSQTQTSQGSVVTSTNIIGGSSNKCTNITIILDSVEG